MYRRGGSSAGGACGRRGSRLGAVDGPGDCAAVQHLHLPERLELVEDSVADAVRDEVVADLGDDVVDDGDIDRGDVAAGHGGGSGSGSGG